MCLCVHRRQTKHTRTTHAQHQKETQNGWRWRRLLARDGNSFANHLKAFVRSSQLHETRASAVQVSRRGRNSGLSHARERVTHAHTPSTHPHGTRPPAAAAVDEGDAGHDGLFKNTARCGDVAARFPGECCAGENAQVKAELLLGLITNATVCRRLRNHMCYCRVTCARVRVYRCTCIY